MPNMGFRGIYAAASSGFGGRITGNDLLPAMRSNLYPAADYFYLNPVDPNFSYSTFILKEVGANTTQNFTFLDSSPSNYTISSNGTINQGTFSPYGFQEGAWSTLFDGTGDYLTVPNDNAFKFGSGDFTIEAWIYLTQTGVENGIWCMREVGTFAGVALRVVAADNRLTMQVASSNSAWGVNPSSDTALPALVANRWYHVAVVRSGSTFKLYLDGVGGTSYTYAGSVFDGTAPGYIGKSDGSAGNQILRGYMSNFRIVKGTAVYTSNFTPSYTPLTSISSTSLLTCQSSRLKDNSTNNFAITLLGDTKISAFSPFNPPTNYQTGSYGGSIYFNGSGNFISVPGNTAFDFGTGDFTVESWVYPTTLTPGGGVNDVSSVINTFPGSGTITGWSVAYTPTGNVSLSSWIAGSQQTLTATSNPVVGNTWNHIAVTNQSGTIRIFVNGNQTTTSGSISQAINSGGNLLKVGGLIFAGYPDFVTGYISSTRIVKGSAVYTSTFTPPSAPLTAIANTSFLINGTNAGIIDSARKSNIYTVGGAKVSTNVFRYEKSVAFNGSSDYLLVPQATVDDLFQFGTGDFTAETWVRFGALGSNRAFMDAWVSGQAASWQMYYQSSSTKMVWYVGSTAVLTSTTTPSLDTWYHVAVARSGSTIRLFVNGNLEANTTNHTLNYNYKAPFAVGVQYSTLTNYLNGYVEDLRITKGLARYTTNFTPTQIIS